jgi:hypothetical protein
MSALPIESVVTEEAANNWMTAMKRNEVLLCLLRRRRMNKQKNYKKRKERTQTITLKAWHICERPTRCITLPVLKD